MIIGKYYIFFKLVLSVWNLMCILHLQDTSFCSGHTSSAQEPQRAGGCHVRQHRLRPSKLLTCLILKTTCTTGTRVPILKPLLFPLDLPTTSKTLLRNCPLQVSFRMKNQGWSGLPQPLKSSLTMAFATLHGGGASREHVAYVASTI